MTTEEIIRRLVARYGRADVTGVALSSPLADVGVDTLAVAQIVVYLEARFDVVVGSLEAARWTTGEAIVVSVERLLTERHRQAS
jgi:acyl carrier protein